MDKMVIFSLKSDINKGKRVLDLTVDSVQCSLKAHFTHPDFSSSVTEHIKLNLDVFSAENALKSI